MIFCVVPHLLHATISTIDIKISTFYVKWFVCVGLCASDGTNDGRVELTVDDDNDNGNDDKQLIVQMDV